MLYQAEGIILTQEARGEYDKVVSVFTREEGLVKAVVRGSRKPTSKLSAVTQPLTRGVFQFYRGRNFDRLIQVDIQTSYPQIGSDYPKLIYASFLCELVLELIPEREPNPDQYTFFIRVLDCIQRCQDPWPQSVWGELGLLARAGFAPTVDQCVACGRPREEDSWFSAEHGGILCRNCRNGAFAHSEAVHLSPGSARTLEMLLGFAVGGGAGCPNINARGKVREEVNEALRQFSQRVLGKKLKSRALVDSLNL